MFPFPSSSSQPSAFLPPPPPPIAAANGKHCWATSSLIGNKHIANLTKGFWQKHAFLQWYLPNFFLNVIKGRTGQHDVLKGFTNQECKNFIEPIFHCCQRLVLWPLFLSGDNSNPSNSLNFCCENRRWRLKVDGEGELRPYLLRKYLHKKCSAHLGFFRLGGEGVETCLPGWFGTSTTPCKKVPHSAHLTKGGVVKSYFGVFFYKETSL